MVVSLHPLSTEKRSLEERRRDGSERTLRGWKDEIACVKNRRGEAVAGDTRRVKGKKKQFLQ